MLGPAKLARTHLALSNAAAAALYSICSKWALATWHCTQAVFSWPLCSLFERRVQARVRVWGREESAGACA
jgi:hypothetical protein